jgi:ribosome-associated protein
VTSTARILAGCQRELTLDFIRASGPGGQNVNKVATAVQVRFDIRRSNWLDADCKKRIIENGGRRVTVGGVLVMESGRYRTQAQNRTDVIKRFVALLEKSLAPPKPRRRTKPSAVSKERRLQSKKVRSRIKQIRRSPTYE